MLSAAPAGRLPAQLDVASIDRKAVDPPVALTHGCALAAAGSSAITIPATARLPRPTIPFFRAKASLPLVCPCVRPLSEMCAEHARHTSQGALSVVESSQRGPASMTA